MSGSVVFKINLNDSDQKFREICNRNFAALARGIVLDGQSLQVIADSDVVTSIIVSMNEKVGIEEFELTIEGLMLLLEDKINFDNLIAGTGIRLTRSGNNVTIALSEPCPIPVNGIFFIDAATNPSTIWPGTSWQTFSSPLSAQAWKRLT